MGDQATGQDLHDLFRAVFRLQGMLAQVEDAAHEKSGMSTPWKRVLHVLAHGGDPTVPDIAMQMGVSRQFVLKTCKDMAGAGFVAFEENPRHKRSKLVRMTVEGEAAYSLAMTREHESIARLLPGVDKAGARRATELLDSLRERMQKIGMEGFLES